MALVVENGSGLTNADSYLSEADADTYHTNHSNSTSWSGASTATKENALRIATQYLDIMYNRRWLGIRGKKEQSLDWPRFGVVDADGYEVANNALPQGLKDATAEAALLHITETNGLLPTLSAQDSNLKRKLVQAGPVKVEREYSGSRQSLPKFSIVDFLVREFTRRSGQILRA